jgi:hypothetical protein
MTLEIVCGDFRLIARRLQMSNSGSDLPKDSFIEHNALYILIEYISLDAVSCKKVVYAVK